MTYGRDLAANGYLFPSMMRTNLAIGAWLDKPSGERLGCASKGPGDYPGGTELPCRMHIFRPVENIVNSRSRLFFWTASGRCPLGGLALSCFLAGIFWHGASTGVAQANAGEGPVTYARDVAPIFRETCESCHRPGMIGPMELTNYEQVRPWAKLIKQQVTSGEMPPFHAAGPIGRYKNDYRLTEEQVGTVTRWVDEGARLGDPADLPPPNVWTSKRWSIGEPDLVLAFTESYRIELNSRDAYVFLPIDHEFEEDIWIETSEIIAHFPDGKVETIFSIPNYDFSWERNYELIEPMLLPKGTEVEMIAAWDNSESNRLNPDPTQLVRIGYGSRDEMLVAGFRYEIPGEEISNPVLLRDGRVIPDPEEGEGVKPP